MRILSILLLFVVSSAFAQKTETRKLSSFSSLDAAEGIEVILEKGSPEARLEVSGADVEDVVTEVSGSTLNIEMRGNNNYRNLDVTVYVKFETIDEVDASSAASVVFKSKLDVSELDLDVSSAAYVQADIDVREVKVDISSSGKVELSGKADELSADISSAANLRASDLVCEEADIDANSAGSAAVHVTGILRAEANSAGKVTYKGDPQKVFADSSSGGKVRKY